MILDKYIEIKINKKLIEKYKYVSNPGDKIIINVFIKLIILFYYIY